MLTNAQLIGILSLVFGAICVIFCLRDLLSPASDLRWEDTLRRVEVLQAVIANARLGDCRDHKLPHRIWIDLEARLREICELTNRAAGNANLLGFDNPSVESQRTVARIRELIGTQSNDQYLLTTALVLAVLMRQVRLLENGNGYVSVSTLCGRLVVMTDEVNSGVRHHDIPVGSDPVSEICKALTLLTDRVVALQTAPSVHKSETDRRRNPPSGR